MTKNSTFSQISATATGQHATPRHVNRQAAWDAYLQAKNNPGQSFDEQQALILASTHGQAATLFASEIPGADIQALQAKVIAVGTGQDLYQFALRVPDADCSALENRLLEVGRPLDLVDFAAHIPTADIARIQKSVLTFGSGQMAELVLFAQLKGPDVAACQARVLRFGNARDLYAFAATVEGADVPALRARHAQLRDDPFWCAKFDELAKRYKPAPVQAQVKAVTAPAKPVAPPAAPPTVSASSARKPTAPVIIPTELPDGTVAPKGRQIDQDVLDVLESCRIEGFHVYLPPTQLNRDLYTRTNEVLSTFGGVWTSGKIKAHVFQEDPAPLLDVAIATGKFIRPQEFGFFPTQPREVERVMAMAQIQPGMNTLEPSAGRGAFALRMLQAVGGDPELVTVCELLPRNAQALKDAGFTKVIQGDFLSVPPDPRFDMVVMNPPFGGGVDIDHVMHATKFLNPTGRLIAITSVGWERNSYKKAQAFRDFIQDVDAFTDDIERGAFKAVGTDVPTKIIAIEAANLPWYRDDEREQPDAPTFS